MAAASPFRLLVPLLLLAGPVVAQTPGRSPVVLEYDADEQLKLKKVDTNGDGKYDEFVHYVGGKTARAERDDDYDGRVDVWIHFRPDGKSRSRQERDSNKDGRADQWIEFDTNDQPRTGGFQPARLA